MAEIAMSAPTSTPLRVCIVAENASFDFGGEASLPLHYFSRLRHRRIEAWLLVHGRTQRELQKLYPSERDRIIYIEDKWYHKLLWRLSSTLPRRVSEASFGLLMVLLNQLLQRSILRRMIERERINIVHQPIPVSPRAPSFIFGLGVPVVIGPMNGGMDYPAAFRREESLMTRAFVSSGRALSNLINTVIAGKINAAALLVANARTRAALPTGTRGVIYEVPENGVDLTIWAPPANPAAPDVPARFMFVGRLVEWKRLDFVLDALAGCPGAVLDVVGDGPMRSEWFGRAESLGLGNRVRWLGWLPQRECAQLMHGASALLLPSIYECGGAVVLEAMACGLPVVATAWGGPVDYLDDTCGILIEPESSIAIIRGFAEAMENLANSPSRAAQLGESGRKRAESRFDWNGKIERVLEVYGQTIARAPARIT